MKKIIEFLFRWDGIWSAPLLLFLFVAFGAFSVDFFGQGIATYDPGIVQALLLASAFLVAINFTTWLGIRFNFPEVYSYYINSFKSDIGNLQLWQRITILLAIYFFLFSAFLFVLQLLL